mmetsp:Transcript_25529/g.31447  ORF Transcript_25529/g.31447 Transcript_25529/m.31447 type:complete len:96 (-) Transcript_25529:84-371(-)
MYHAPLQKDATPKPTPTCAPREAKPTPSGGVGVCFKTVFVITGRDLLSNFLMFRTILVFSENTKNALYDTVGGAVHTFILYNPSNNIGYWYGDGD